MINIENLQGAQKFVKHSQELAKEVHSIIVLENCTAGSLLLQSLSMADARADAAYLVLNALDDVGAKGATEIDEEIAEKLLAQLKAALAYVIHGNHKGSEAVETLREYVRWLEQAILTAR